MALFFLYSCEDPGFVGSKFLQSEHELISFTIPIEQVTPVTDVAYAGNLGYMSIGEYQDPLFGLTRSIGYLKPSINTSNLTSMEEGDVMRLRLVLDARYYGNDLASSEFEVYEVNEYWRGNEIRLGDEISYDTNVKVGEFSITNSDTVYVDLAQSWVDEYIQYLNADGVERDSLYSNEFFGLALVPVSGDSKIVFPKMFSTTAPESDDLEFVRFIVDGEDEERQYQTLTEWGSGITRSSIPDTPESTYVVQNTLENFLEIDLGLTEEDFSSKNLVNVELVFFQDLESTQNSLPPGHERLETSTARIHIISTNEIGDNIFNRSPALAESRDTVDNSFRFNLTDYANSVLYSTPPSGKLYLSIGSLSGLLYSSYFHSGELDESLRPRIIVTALKETGE